MKSKNKFKIIIVVVILLIVGVLLAIPKTTYESWFSNEDKVNDELTNVPAYTKLVYLENSNKKIVGVNVKVDSLEEDEIFQKWNLLTANSDKLPEGYTSVINKDAVLNSYEIKEQVLVMDVSPEIKLSNGRSAIETIAWTFLNDEIEEVVLITNGEQVREIGDYRINKITKKMGINLEYETGYLLESTATTIIYSEKDYLLPVTYFHLEEDICTFIVDKTFEKFSDQYFDYEYELNEEVLVINLLEDVNLSEDALKTLTSSVEINFELIKFSVNNVNENLYEAVFGEIIEE